jgi:hypothetical protein
MSFYRLRKIIVWPFRYHSARLTRDVPDRSIVGGNPASVLKSTEEYLEGAHRKSLGIGHLHGDEKIAAYKHIINEVVR